MVTEIFKVKIGESLTTTNSILELKESGYNLRNKSCLKTEKCQKNSVWEEILKAPWCKTMGNAS